MRPFTPRKRSSTRAATPTRSGEQQLREILAGPDDAHRRELEILLEDSRR